MIKNLFFSHLTRRSRWPSMRATWLILGAASAAGLAFCILALAADPQEVGGWLWPITAPLARLVLSASTMQSPYRALYLAGFATSIGGAAVSAVITITATVRDAQSEAFQLVRMTPLSEKVIVRGYLSNALFQLRPLLAAAFGLLPPLFVVLTYTFMDILFFNCPTIVTCPPWTFAASRPTAMAMSAAILTVIALAGCALSWLGVCVGVWASLWQRRFSPALAVSCALLAFLALLVFYPSWQRGIDLFILSRAPRQLVQWFRLLPPVRFVRQATPRGISAVSATLPLLLTPLGAWVIRRAERRV